MHTTTPPKALTAFVAGILALSLGLPGTQPAFAETTDIDAQPNALQQEIERTALEYDESIANLEGVEAQIEDTQARIAELEAELPDQRQKSGEAVKSIYTMQSQGFSLFDLLLGTQTIDDFITTFEYLDHVNSKHLKEVNRLTSLKAELEETERALEETRQDAETEKIRAEDALKNAQAAREEAQKKAEAAAAAEQAAAEKAQADTVVEQEQTPEETPALTPDTGSSDPAPANPGEVDWSADKSAFVNQWAGRIDAYLSGSPLAGQGRTFAEAAWNNGVDPRWSPAISFTESSKGANCYASHNAWGWGGISWSSWEEAINAHVQGLARGYGYTISVESAKKYCPPSWEHWYNTTLAQMEMI